MLSNYVYFSHGEGGLGPDDLLVDSPWADWLDPNDVSTFKSGPGLNFGFHGFKAKYLLGEGQFAVDFTLSSNGTSRVGVCVCVCVCPSR